jgi:alpha-ketoglutarate-dependent taurine dioxygenase
MSALSSSLENPLSPAGMSSNLRMLTASEVASDSPNPNGFISIVEKGGLKDHQQVIDDEALMGAIRDGLDASGSVLLRGMPIKDTAQAEAILTALDVTFDDEYLGGASPRSRLSDHFFTSTEAPAPYVISFHTEMCYLKNRPGKIFFYCITQPEKYGETSVFDCAEIFANLPSELQHKIETLGVMYQRYFVNKKARFFNVYKTWMDSFQAETREQAEEACRQQGLDFEWQGNGGLVTRNRMPGMIVDPKSGKKCISLTLYNSESAPYDMYTFRQRINPLSRLWLTTFIRSQYARKNVFLKTLWGDGSEITAAETRLLIDTAWQNSNLFNWKQGDLLILDNIRCGHGRLNVVKPRKIAAALGDPYSV